MTKRVLVAGATGALGRHVSSTLAARGWHVRALSRDVARATAVAGVVDVHHGDALDLRSLAGACNDVDVVFSCVGASIDPSPRKGWRSYLDVDVPAHTHLIEVAETAGVGRFVYVSASHDAAMRDLHYIAAHERVVERLRASKLPWNVLRPTGFFSAYAMLFALAQRGVAPLFGDGSARSNPIDEADLAIACADAVEGNAPRELALGGPEVLSRREAIELAFRAFGRTPRMVSMPVGLVRAVCWLLRAVLPRTAHITEFVAHVSTHDCLAPAYGSRTLAAYYASLAGARRTPGVT
jgi:uncharacterized protein YbjT (DUF2867 family)